jgi:hypothetical protein
VNWGAHLDLVAAAIGFLAFWARLEHRLTKVEVQLKLLTEQKRR